MDDRASEIEEIFDLRPNDQIGWTSLSLFYNRNGQIPEAESAGTKARILSWGGKLRREEQ